MNTYLIEVKTELVTETEVKAENFQDALRQLQGFDMQETLAYQLTQGLGERPFEYTVEEILP